jgi:hypothetical protein
MNKYILVSRRHIMGRITKQFQNLDNSNLWNKNRCRRLLAYETLSLSQAKAYAKKPKAGGAARPLYLEQELGQPRKRARTEERQQEEGQSVPGPSNSSAGT